MTSVDATDVANRVSNCTCARLRRLTRRMTALYDRELAQTGLRLTQYSLLATLRGKEGITASRFPTWLLPWTWTERR
jgi:hypothetical protein